MREVAGSVLIVLAVLWPAIAYYYAYEFRNKKWPLWVTFAAVGILGAGVISLSEMVPAGYSTAFSVVGYALLVGFIFGYHKLWLQRFKEKKAECAKNEEA